MLTATSFNKVIAPVVAPILLGLLVATVTIVMLLALRPVLVAFAFGALIIVIPTFVVRHVKAYWLLLFVLSLLFDISKRVTSWLADPLVLLERYGFPPSGNLSIHIYLSDVVFFALVVPWAVNLALKKERLFFPRVAYIYVLYLVWAIFSSLINAPSLYLAAFEWVRQLLYFATFLYIVNNVVSPAHIRAVLIAVTLGCLIETFAVFALYIAQVGTEYYVFAGLYQERSETGRVVSSPLYTAEEGSGRNINRSSGTFAHPAQAAYYLEFILPVMLAAALACRGILPRLLFLGALTLGCAGLVLTFSRSGFLGFLAGACIVLFVARWRGLFGKKSFAMLVLFIGMAFMAVSPKVYDHLTARPEAFYFRFGLMEKGLNLFLERPILGAGLNNSTAVAEDYRTTRTGELEKNIEIIHNHYLIMAVEVGLIGFLLYFGFFSCIVLTSIRNSASSNQDTAMFSIGALGAFASIALHGMADPFGGHTLNAMLWLYAGMVVALERLQRCDAALRRERYQEDQAGGPAAALEHPAMRRR